MSGTRAASAVSAKGGGAAGEASLSSSKLARKVAGFKITNGKKDVRRIGIVGSELGLKYFLARLESNVGRITYEQVKKKWGVPNRMKEDRDEMKATWLWPFEPNDKTAPGDDDEGSHGEQVDLTFRRSDGVLKDWNYDRF